MQEDFGSALRHARVRKGLDVNTVARRLRIRPDIIQAIEDSDFERMPPRGYARNMINSYAQLVGLNPNDLTRQYLDAQYAHQVNQARKNVRGTGFDMSAADRRGSSRGTASQRMAGRGDQYEVSGYQRGDLSQSRNARQRDRYTMSDNGRRRMYDDSDSGRIASHSEVDRTYRSGGHRSRGTALGDEPYLNAVASPAPSGMRGGRFASIGWPTIAVVAAALVLAIILLVLLFGPKGGSNEDVENMPVNSASETEATESTASVAAQAPTSFTFSYTVSSGATTWIEVFIDGQQQLAENVTGPSTKTFTTSGELEFICADASGVKATQDGKDITLTPGEDGVVDIKISFNDILAKWQEEHGISVSVPSSSSSSQSLRGINEEGRAAASASTHEQEEEPQEEYVEEETSEDTGYTEDQSGYYAEENTAYYDYGDAGTQDGGYTDYSQDYQNTGTDQGQYYQEG